MKYNPQKIVTKPVGAPLVGARNATRNVPRNAENKTGNHAELPHRKSIRLTGYDYSQAGFYFITICCQNRKCLLGEIVNGKMVFNDAGKMIKNEWLKLPQRFNKIKLHEFIVMPNHFHGIIVIESINGHIEGHPQGSPYVWAIWLGRLSPLRPAYIRGVKNSGWQRFDGNLWQRNFWEHIIRDENEYQHISEYIMNNPMKWDMDK